MHKESINMMRTIAPTLKIILISYMIFILLPINHMFNTNIQTIIGELQFNNIHTYPRRIIITLFLLYAYLINDPMLVALLVLFILHDTKFNYHNR